jgi:hypothetical protein
MPDELDSSLLPEELRGLAPLDSQVCRERRVTSLRLALANVTTRAKRPARLHRERASGRHGEGGLKFASGDPNDARFEVGPGIL